MTVINWVLRSRSGRALLGFLLFYVGFGVFLFFFQERLLYHPPSYTFDTCPLLPEARVERVNGTRLFVEDVSDKVLVIYQGNAGTVCDRAVYAEAAKEAGWGYILVSYTSYGDGGPRTTHESIRADVRNAVSYLEEKAYTEVRVLGESIGSGVAGYHVTLLPPTALLLITPFDTLENVARHHYWFYPTSLMVQEAYGTAENLREYKGRVTIVHGTDDAVVPYERGKALYESLETSEKMLVTVEGANHNDLWLYESPEAVIKEFLK